MALWLVYSSPDRAVPACVAAVSFPFLFRRRDRTRRQASGRAKKCGWVSKKLEGGGVGGVSGEKGSCWVARLLPLLLIFFTRSQFRSLRALILEKLATQARAMRVRTQAGDTVFVLLGKALSQFPLSAQV